jgi:putative peptidoglycan lipid II flippase
MAPMSSTSVARTTAWLALGTGTSRLLGLVRTILLGAAIGITGAAAADAFSVANKLPNVMFAVIAAGVLNSALVPQIVKSFHAGRERTVHRILTLGGFWMMVATVIFTLLAGLWVRLYSSDWGPEQTALATAFAFWCIPQLFFYGMYTLLGQVLNAREQFGPYMWAPVASNLVAITGLLIYIVTFGHYAVSADGGLGSLAETWTGPRIALIAGTATLGIVMQAAVLIPPLIRGGYRWRWTWGGPKGELVTVAKVASWALAAVLVEQVAVALTTRVSTAAQAAAPGDPSVAGVAGYDYALSIYLVPHSLVTVSLMTILFTRMSRHASDKNIRGLKEVLTGGIRSVGTFTIFAAAVLIVLAPHIVRALAPVSSAETVSAVAFVVECLALGLVPLGASVLVKQAYFALEDGRSVFLIHLPMAIAWIGIAYAFRATTDPQWWVPGVALGLAASNTVALALRGWGLRRRLGGLDGRRVAATYGKALVAAGGAVVVGLAVRAIAPESFHETGWMAVVKSLAVVVAGGGAMLATYVAIARLVGLHELNDVVRAFTRRLRRRVP